MAFPFNAIKSIDRVHFDVQLKKTDKKGQDLQKNMFEIFLKEDFLDIFLRPDYEQLFNPDTKRRNYLLQKISKELKTNTSPNKKGIKELY